MDTKFELFNQNVLTDEKLKKYMSASNFKKSKNDIQNSSAYCSYDKNNNKCNNN